ncbi:hypothetical protein GCM10011507_13180 [Edaphobacter acidisoli]|uniref:Adenylate cyclase n=1 Tax=Edaphobacter acidisoli TaxID=2040573 RepID=A0A916RNG6_9BACT|nr:hypothetical protein [Edaphobacter acidisoli]GGA62938.1 hypothetical protein GCM10011507_13180 [Edaphobacter acidisoli]
MDVETAADHAEMPAVAECHRQVERILQSSAFRNASTLQQLLQFIAARSLEKGVEPLKEYVIGVEAFGRPADFDPKTDTIVRVQTHRLRLKLKEYYEGEGRRDPILVEIPKGHYLAQFETSTELKGILDGEGQTSQSIRAGGPRGTLGQGVVRHPGRIALWIGTVCALGLIFTAGLWTGKHRGAQSSPLMSGNSLQAFATGDDPVKAFWASFVGDDQNPVIAYPDAVFLLDNSNDLFRYRQGASDDRGSLVDPHLARQFASNPDLVEKAGALYYENGYTGAGELQAVAMLAGLFGQMGLRPIIKPSRDITPVDLRQHSVILLGSSFQNVAVAQLMTPGDFRFINPDTHLEQWRAEIVNTQPHPGEAASYHTGRDPVTHVLKQDYAIFSVQSGVITGRHIAVLGGLDTTGTEGATMFATSQSGVEELAKGLSVTKQKNQALIIPQFQALVRVRLEKGSEVLGASLEAIHKIDVANTHSTDGSTSLPAQSQ